MRVSDGKQAGGDLEEAEMSGEALLLLLIRSMKESGGGGDDP